MNRTGSIPDRIAGAHPAGSVAARAAERQPDTKQLLGGLRHLGIKRGRRQIHSVREPIGDDAERRQPGEPLVVGRHEVPGGLPGGGRLQHILDRPLVILSAGIVAKILAGQFPALQWIGQAGSEPMYLFLGRDVQEDFHQPRIVFQQHPLERVDLGISSDANRRDRCR